ncbi:MAG: nucleoside triphosphate pyrophosphohydrolase [Steroidobacteraceae bacterium]
MSAAAERLDALLQLMARLRDPQRGCPWDREQDFSTIAPHTIEEAYELEEAITGGEPKRIRDELGDLLFQVVFHAQMASERGWFNFADVAAGVHDKLVRRHPHVFGGAVGEGQADLSRAWDQAKAAERAASGAHGALAGVAVALPALSRAAKLARRAGAVGFDWFDEHAVRPKIAEELRETEQAIATGNAVTIEEELGDTLFALANWARLLHVDPENALRSANRKFERRFAAMEALMAERGWKAADLDAERWDELWVSVKSTE